MSAGPPDNVIQNIQPFDEYTGPIVSVRRLSYIQPLVDINLKNLEAYYQIVREHVDKSFRVSRGAGIGGFVLIGAGMVWGMVWAVLGGGQDRSLTYLSGAAGIVTEFISAVFFYLYNRTVRQMKEYHDSLLRVQNILLCFTLIDDTHDPNQRDRMLEAIVQHLVGRSAGIQTRSPDQGTSQSEDT